MGKSKNNFVKAESYFSSANELLAQGRFEEAEEEYSKAIELKPDYTDAHYNLGLVSPINK